MTRSLIQQLRDAWVSQDITLEELLARTELEMSLESLSRKLSGKQICTTDECETLAKALGINLVFAPDVAAQSSSARPRNDKGAA